MAKDTTPLLIRCERAAKAKKDFSVSESGEKHSVNPNRAQRVLDYFNLLNVNARNIYQGLPVKNQLELADTVTLFTAEPVAEETEA